MSLTAISTAVLDWYARHARSLPWRGTRDPYAIWISEVMLQQTQVETVIPYYHNWMERFPTLESLAQASEAEVLSAWEGLGYYSRARNLRRAALMVVNEMGGALPHDVSRLAKLPGVGRYTAGAIAAIAFNQDAPALDGNIRRVLARLFNVALPPRSPAGERRLWELAAEHLPPGRAGDYIQGLMDLGATICTPRMPDCPRCPLHDPCLARRLGIQEQRPLRVEKAAVPHVTVAAAVIRQSGLVLIAQRPSNGLLGGLWEFPGGKLEAGEDLTACLKREICEELDADINVGAALGVYQHAYTHFRVTVHAFCCTLAGGREPRALQVQDLRWVPPAELHTYPMGKVDRRIALRLAQAAEGSAEEAPC